MTNPIIVTFLDTRVKLSKKTFSKLLENMKKICYNNKNKGVVYISV